MLLGLPGVTILGIDCLGADLRIEKAVSSSMRFVDFADAVVIVNSDAVGVPADMPNAKNIRRVFEIQDDRLSYEKSAMVSALEHTSTPFVLFVEWDSRVANPLGWDKSWLKYDYIGAPWPRHNTPGWPPCSHENCVGNGGFSLRSRRFYECSAEIMREFPDDPGMIIHDAWLCRTHRQRMVDMGIVFAPPHVAYRFSCETQYYSGQFGWHGKVTAEINGFTFCDP